MAAPVGSVLVAVRVAGSYPNVQLLPSTITVRLGVVGVDRFGAAAVVVERRPPSLTDAMTGASLPQRGSAASVMSIVRPPGMVIVRWAALASRVVTAPTVSVWPQRVADPRSEER